MDASAAAAQNPAAPCGAALIAGGLGSLGQLVAVWLAKQGVRSLILVGRSGRGSGPWDPDTASILLGSDGILALVSLERCDAASGEEARGTFAARAGRPPPAAVFQAGGVLADAVLTAQTPSSVRAAFAPKVDSCRVVSELIGGLPVTSQVWMCGGWKMSLAIVHPF